LRARSSQWTQVFEPMDPHLWYNGPMRIQEWCWYCERCHHKWLCLSIDAPEKCAKCKRRNWHTKRTTAEPVVFSGPRVVIPEVKMNPAMAKFMAKVPEIAIAPPEPALGPICGKYYRDEQRGESFKCGRQKHSVKTPCGMFIRLDD
jgi:hypothetical protein